ncbi:hypothetical protein [Shewanella woodyi]|nr:hypothetical protein [Shewanella woodyi]
MQKNVWNIFCPVGFTAASMLPKLVAAPTPVHLSLRFGLTGRIL